MRPHWEQDATGTWWYYFSRGRRRAIGEAACEECGTTFRFWAKATAHNPNRFCSQACGLRSLGNGGRRRTGHGYVYLLQPDHPSIAHSKTKYVAEHRLVMEAHLGRYLKREETVHHRNGIRDDNRIENLELWTGNHGNGVRAEEVGCPAGLHDYYDDGEWF